MSAHLSERDDGLPDEALRYRWVGDCDGDGFGDGRDQRAESGVEVTTGVGVGPGRV